MAADSQHLDPPLVSFRPPDKQLSLFETIRVARENGMATIPRVAYEELDESRGDQLEALLFRPVQGAYGRLRRTHSDFATRSMKWMASRASRGCTRSIRTRCGRSCTKNASRIRSNSTIRPPARSSTSRTG